MMDDVTARAWQAGSIFNRHYEVGGKLLIHAKDCGT